MGRCGRRDGTASRGSDDLRPRRRGASFRAHHAVDFRRSGPGHRRAAAAEQRQATVRTSPAAARARQRSQTAFGDLTAPQALAVAKRELPSAMRRNPTSPLRLTAATTLKGYLNAHTALVQMPGGKRALAVSPTGLQTRSVRASGSDGPLAPSQGPVRRSLPPSRQAPARGDSRLAVRLLADDVRYWHRQKANAPVDQSRRRVYPRGLGWSRRLRQRNGWHRRCGA